MVLDEQRIRYLLIIQAVSMGAMEMSGPFWPLRLQSLLPAEQQGLLSLLSALVYVLPLIGAMVTTPFWGRMGDHTGHKPMLIRTLVALGICQWVIVFITDPWGLIIIRGTQGMLAGFIAVAQAYALADCPSTKRGWVLSKLQAATAVGSTMGPVAGGVILDWTNFEWICLAAGAICLACVGPVLHLPADTPRREHASAASTSAHRENTTHWLVALLGIIILIQAAKMLPQPFFALYLTDVMHAPAWLVGASYAATGFALALSAPIWGRVNEGQTPLETFRLLEVVAWASAITLCLTALSNHWLAFMTTRIFWGFWQGALLPLAYTLILAGTSDTHRGFFIGLGNSAAKAGALVGITLGAGSMAWPGIASGFWVVALVYGLAALVIRVVRHRFFITKPLRDDSRDQH